MEKGNLTQKRRNSATQLFLRKFSFVRVWMLDVINSTRSPSQYVQLSPNPRHFLEQISDGIILCHLINALRPHTINDITHPSRTLQFIYLNNINSFLDACINHFNIGKNSLFEPMELFEKKNLVKVVYCLSSLMEKVPSTFARLDFDNPSSKASSFGSPSVSGSYLVSSIHQSDHMHMHCLHHKV